MGNYPIRLSEEVRNLCMIILPWGKYRYKYLPMGVSNSPELFQDKPKTMFHVFGFIRLCINSLLVITKVDCTDKLEKLEQRIQNLKEK